MNETKKAVISVLGTDRKGIIAQVSRILYETTPTYWTSPRPSCPGCSA